MKKLTSGGKTVPKIPDISTPDFMNLSTCYSMPCVYSYSSSYIVEQLEKELEKISDVMQEKIDNINALKATFIPVMEIHQLNERIKEQLDMVKIKMAETSNDNSKGDKFINDIYTMIDNSYLETCDIESLNAFRGTLLHSDIINPCTLYTSCSLTTMNFGIDLGEGIDYSKEVLYLLNHLENTDNE